jgi:hypothetical protein
MLRHLPVLDAAGVDEGEEDAEHGRVDVWHHHLLADTLLHSLVDDRYGDGMTDEAAVRTNGYPLWAHNESHVTISLS